MTVAPLSLMTLLSPSPPSAPPAVSGPSGPPPPRPAGFWKVPPSPARKAELRASQSRRCPALRFPLPAPPRVGPGRELTRVRAALYDKGEARGQGRLRPPGEEGSEPRSSEAGEEALGRWPGPAPPDSVTPERLPV
ncbi:unnamed protein product [Rangifer tarandus platyrhynchus]|uniref:Uncharacterized protein n=2 Tax=Rangifer tarandus platyrhynchus TaxID=3082113 RepID=A0AC59YTH5_RANTA|nr:unnamed protein product [Rangifer tarandus platyrhynchus]